MTLQDLCNAFYAVDNVVTVRITMAPADWDALKAAEPHGGFCNFQFTGERFDWFHATSVEISGTALPGGPQSFADVGISKKSFCGSFSKTKPSLRLNFSRFTDHEDAIEALIGTQYVTLHNSVQDASYIRQPLGYELFRLAGMPHSRCNIARVIVNGEDQGTYVNCEPVRKRHIQNTFGNDEGNLYEIEAGEDLTEAMVTAGRLTHQGFSDVEDGSDLLLAAQRIAAGPAAAAEVVYLPSFQRFYAMETLLKHWDGYTSNANNAYVYNDVIPIAAPDVAHVHLKFIPWGLDQILQPATSFNLDDDSVLARLVRQDPTLLDGVRAQITDLLNTVFSRDSIEGVILPYIARLETALAISGATGRPASSGRSATRSGWCDRAACCSRPSRGTRPWRWSNAAPSSAPTPVRPRPSASTRRSTTTPCPARARTAGSSATSSPGTSWSTRSSAPSCTPAPRS